MKAKSFAVSALIIGLGIYLIFRFSSSGKEEKEEGVTEHSPTSSTTNFLASAGKWYGIEIDPFAGPFDIKPSGDNITWFARVVQVGNFTNSLTMHPNGRKINWGNGVTNVWVMSPKDVSFLVRKQVR
jgi:hypothetical protein